jgi:hypothetical protein
VRAAHPDDLDPNGQTVRITYLGDDNYTATLRQESV